MPGRPDAPAHGGRPGGTFVPAVPLQKIPLIGARSDDARPQRPLLPCLMEETHNRQETAVATSQPTRPSRHGRMADCPPRSGSTAGHPRRAGPHVGAVLAVQPRRCGPARAAGLAGQPGRAPADRQRPAYPQGRQRVQHAMTGARDGGRRRMLRRRPWLLRHAGRRHLAAGPSRTAAPAGRAVAATGKATRHTRAGRCWRRSTSPRWPLGSPAPSWPPPG